MSGMLRVTYKVSSIGHKKNHKLTVRSLGLYKLNHTVELPDRPEVRAMLNSVKHLVTWEEAPAAPTGEQE
jgi:large subunit ribosomal protein L30